MHVRYRTCNKTESTEADCEGQYVEQAVCALDKCPGNFTLVYEIFRVKVNVNQPFQYFNISLGTVSKAAVQTRHNSFRTRHNALWNRQNTLLVGQLFKLCVYV